MMVQIYLKNNSLKKLEPLVYTRARGAGQENEKRLHSGVMFFSFFLDLPGSRAFICVNSGSWAFIWVSSGLWELVWNFIAEKSGFIWGFIQGRQGFIWDVTGDGRDLSAASFGVDGDLFGAIFRDGEFLSGSLSV